MIKVANTAFIKPMLFIFKILPLIAILSGCETMHNYSDQALKHPAKIPNIWSAQGRLSVTTTDKVETAGFEIEFEQQNYKLKLNATLGLGQVIIESREHGLLVNSQTTNMSFDRWMMNKMGWYFPINDIDKILFQSATKISNRWDVSISSYKNINGINYPKVVRFNHLEHPIKIKLVLSNINS